MDAIAEIRAVVAASPRPRPNHPYSPEVRRRVVLHARRRLAAGACFSRIAEEVGLDVGTVRNWCAKEAWRTSLVPVVLTPGPEPAISAPLPPPSPPPPSSLTVVTPGGYRLEGLDIDDALLVLRRLP